MSIIASINNPADVSTFLRMSSKNTHKLMECFGFQRRPLIFIYYYPYFFVYSSTTFMGGYSYNRVVVELWIVNENNNEFFLPICCKEWRRHNSMVNLVCRCNSLYFGKQQQQQQQNQRFVQGRVM